MTLLRSKGLQLVLLGSPGHPGKFQRTSEISRFSARSSWDLVGPGGSLGVSVVKYERDSGRERCPGMSIQ